MIYLGNTPVGVAVKADALELVGQITVSESWENDTKGNGKTIMDDYIIPLIQNYNDFEPFYVKTYNNLSSSYRFESGFFYKGRYGTSETTGIRENSTGYSVRQFYSASSSFWCSQGTVIKVYRIII